MTNDLPTLDLFFGDLTANYAHVYARLPRPDDGGGLSLSGQVRGPRCLHAQTLPFSTPLVDLGPGPTLLARAVVPDPCFWSPNLPSIYDVTVQLRRGAEIVATARRELGLRSLGVRGRHFALGGKTWVLRGVTAASATVSLARDWHAAAATHVGPFGEERLAEASQWGAISVVELAGQPAALVAELRRLTLYPAAAMAVIGGSLPADFAPKSAAPNVLLLQRLEPGSEAAVEAWADGLWVAADDPARLNCLLAAAERPIIAVRRLAQPQAIAAARTACDELQRDLAPLGQFAGYVV